MPNKFKTYKMHKLPDIKIYGHENQEQKYKVAKTVDKKKYFRDPVEFHSLENKELKKK